MRRRWIPIGASALRGLAPLLLILAETKVWGYRFWIDLAVISIALADGVFAWSIADFTRGTSVAPVPRHRRFALLALSAASVAVTCVTIRAPPPSILFAMWAAVLLWTALEIRGVARRMRALEPA